MNKPLMTSIDEIAKHEPCEEGWDALLKLRGHEPCSIEDFKGDPTLFNVSEIGKLDNVSWLCWTARLYEGDEDKLRIYRWFALWCAERVRHLMKDDRSIAALETARKYLSGETSIGDARKAADAAANAATDATVDAANAAYAAAYAAAAAAYAAAYAAANAAYAAAAVDAVGAAVDAAAYATAAATAYAAANAAAVGAADDAVDAERKTKVTKLSQALEKGEFVNE